MFFIFCPTPSHFPFFSDTRSQFRSQSSTLCLMESEEAICRTFDSQIIKFSCVTKNHLEFPVDALWSLVVPNPIAEIVRFLLHRLERPVL